jgi:hypothetical protein
LSWERWRFTIRRESRQAEKNLSPFPASTWSQVRVKQLE